MAKPINASARFFFISLKKNPVLNITDGFVLLVKLETVNGLVQSEMVCIDSKILCLDYMADSFTFEECA